MMDSGFSILDSGFWVCQVLIAVSRHFLFGQLHVDVCWSRGCVDRYAKTDKQLDLELPSST